MRLISLTANAESFHTVTFNKTGPSFIVGRQQRKEPPEEDKGDQDSNTSNGVGKSLLLYLVNFCLGADPNESFAKQLDGWAFTLRVEVEGNEVPITRSVAEQDVVQYGAARMSLNDFRDTLQDQIFPETAEVKFLTLRSLISAFLRPGKMAYTKWDGIHMSEKPVQRLVRCAYLLGLDVNLVIEKYVLIDELKANKELSARFAKDPIIKEYFQGKKDVGLTIQELQDRLDVLERGVAGFKVAENYHEVEVDADTLKSQLQKIRNSAVAVAAQLRHIEESLKVSPEVSLKSVREIYEKANIHFPAPMLRTLEEVERFHLELLAARSQRLKKERTAHQQRLSACESRIESLNEELNGKLKFLNDHGALGELMSLKDRAAEVKSLLQKLIDFKNLTKKLKDRSGELQVELATSHVKARKYLDSNQDLLTAVENKFRQFTKRLYPDKQSGLSIENDEGDNQSRFKIEAKIISDSSDGINEAKLFAYDVTVAALRLGHRVRFICHDSRLYSDIDPRQRAEIFRIAYEVSKAADFQYIATVNQDQIDALRNLLGTDYQSIIGDNIVLELKDDTPADKLLGIEVDIEYD